MIVRPKKMIGRLTPNGTHFISVTPRAVRRRVANRSAFVTSSAGRLSCSANVRANWLAPIASRLFNVVFVLFGLGTRLCFGQDEVGVIIDAINVEIRLDNVELGEPAVQAKTQVQKQMRGLIQNELCVLESIAVLDDTLKQSIVDLAEEEWRAKTNDSVNKRLQQHVWGNIDLDGLAERAVRNWLLKSNASELLTKYDEELADRMLFRKQMVISNVIDVHAEKLKLSSSQMEQFEAVLNEKWKDKWFRSLEATFNNPSAMPEIRPSWISTFLTPAQKAAMVTRDNSTTYGASQISQDSPSLDLGIRFRMGKIASSESIALEPEIKKENLKKSKDIVAPPEPLRQEDATLPN